MFVTRSTFGSNCRCAVAESRSFTFSAYSFTVNEPFTVVLATPGRKLTRAGPPGKAGPAGAGGAVAGGAVAGGAVAGGAAGATVDGPATTPSCGLCPGAAARGARLTLMVVSLPDATACRSEGEMVGLRTMCGIRTITSSDRSFVFVSLLNR